MLLLPRVSVREWACSDLGTNAQSFILLSHVCSQQEAVWVRVCSGFCSFDWTLHADAPDVAHLVGGGGVLQCIKALVSLAVSWSICCESRGQRLGKCIKDTLPRWRESSAAGTIVWDCEELGDIRGMMML